MSAADNRSDASPRTVVLPDPMDPVITMTWTLMPKSVMQVAREAAEHTLTAMRLSAAFR